MQAMKKNLLLLVVCVLPLSACNTYTFGHRDRDANVEQRLDKLIDQYQATKGGPDDNPRYHAVDHDRARNEIERLALEYPGHVRTLMTCAVLSYECKEPEKAQNFLDQLFRAEPAHPDAGVLRSRIAIDEGNLPLAKRVLEMQIQYRPDHAGLREAHSGVLYLSGELEGAGRSIDAAERLGAPAWRVAYHRGLLAEAAGDAAAARRQYEAAAQANPAFLPAKSRLSGMNAEGM